MNIDCVSHSLFSSAGLAVMSRKLPVNVSVRSKKKLHELIAAVETSRRSSNSVLCSVKAVLLPCHGVIRTLLV